MRVLDRKIHLDFVNGEIEVYIPLPSGNNQLVDKSIFRRKEILDRLSIEKKRRAWNKLRRIEYWLKILPLRQREAIFWRIINHDYEKASVYDETNEQLRYKTLSYQEIANKMNINKKNVRKLVLKALENLENLTEDQK